MTTKYNYIKNLPAKNNIFALLRQLFYTPNILTSGSNKNLATNNLSISTINIIVIVTLILTG